jgi:hypothetical protein
VDYQYDIFLSYRHDNEWPRFIKKHFKPKLSHWLDTKLEAKSKIFFDEQSIETGAAWPHSLADGLAYSKIMVCLWSKQYFSSLWCKAELKQMLLRRTALTKPNNAPPRLIIAVAIDDCDEVHDSISDIQKFPLQEYSDPWIADNSLADYYLSQEIRHLADHVATALLAAPEFDPNWPQEVGEDFDEVFINQVSQRDLPSLG